mgnify:CR=1 FL=1
MGNVVLNAGTPSAPEYLKMENSNPVASTNRTLGRDIVVTVGILLAIAGFATAAVSESPDQSIKKVAKIVPVSSIPVTEKQQAVTKIGPECSIVKGGGIATCSGVHSTMEKSAAAGTQQPRKKVDVIATHNKHAEFPA